MQRSAYIPSPGSFMNTICRIYATPRYIVPLSITIIFFLIMATSLASKIPTLQKSAGLKGPLGCCHYAVRVGVNRLSDNL